MPLRRVPLALSNAAPSPANDNPLSHKGWFVHHPKNAIKSLITRAFKHCRVISLMLPTGRMDRTIRKYTNFDEVKADEYRYWQSRPVHERVAAVSELTQAQYAMKGEAPDVPRLQRTLVRFERAPG